MTTFKIGISNYPYDRERYYAEFPVVELRQAGLLALHRDKTLRKWTAAAPTSFEQIWVAQRHFTHDAKSIRGGKPIELPEGERRGALGLFQDTPENRRLWNSISRSAKAAGATHVLLETPTSLAPSPQNKARLRAFAEDWGALEESGLKIIWDPSGFWQREETIELALELGFILAVDPFVDLDEPMPPGPVGYLRLAGARGLGQEHSRDDLELLIELAGMYQEAYVIFRTNNALHTATRFRKSVEALAALTLNDPLYDDDLLDDDDDLLDDDDDLLDDDDDLSDDDDDLSDDDDDLSDDNDDLSDDE